MKKYKLLLSLFIIVANVETFWGQNITGVIGNMNTSTPRTVYDTAFVKVYYEMEQIEDTTKSDKKKAQTVLLNGDTYFLFLDAYSLLSDSIFYATEDDRADVMRTMSEAMEFARKEKYTQTILGNIQKNDILIREKSWGTTYEYTESLPQINWTLIDKDTTINDILCKKATCRYRGRNYTAWYAYEISLPLGPYLFRGLPGLIIQIKDNSNHYSFTLNGLEFQPKTMALIYLKKLTMLMTGTRDKIRAMIRKTKVYPVEQILNDSKIKVAPETAKKLNRESTPYNPIELE